MKGSQICLLNFFFLPFFFLHINEGGKIIKLHVVIYTFQKKRISKGEEVSRSNETSSYIRFIFYYLTIIPRVCIGYNHLISNKRKWNNCFIKNAHKMSRILPDFICKNNRFSAYF